MTGGNAEAVPDRKRKIVNEEKTSDEAKKVKLSALTSEQPSSSSPSSPSPSTQEGKKGKKKSLLGQLLTDGKVEAGRGFGLFD
jgi:hypothetical protein